MDTLTIPKKMTRGEILMVVPKKDWEALQKVAKAKLFRLELEAGLREALQEVKEGKIIGPFDDVNGLFKALESK